MSFLQEGIQFVLQIHFPLLSSLWVGFVLESWIDTDLPVMFSRDALEC